MEYNKTMSKNKSKRHFTKKPGIIMYPIFRFLTKVIGSICFKKKCIQNDLKKIKGPAVIIANHGTAMDFLNIVSTVKQKINIVISNSFYQTIGFNRTKSKVGLIPKQQFQTSPADLKTMKEVVDHQGLLVFYPAGVMTESGLGTPIPKSTSKFIKWLNCDVYVAFSFGAYLSSPKWSKIRRRGTTEIRIVKIITKEQLQEINLEQLDEIIDSNLSFDEYRTNDIKKVKFKNGDNVEGLENVLYRCPHCSHEFSFSVVNKKTLVCDNCGYAVEADEYGLLHSTNLQFKYISEWAYWQDYNRYHELLNTNDFEMTSNCTIEMLDYQKHKYVNVGSGNISLNNRSFTLKGTINGEEFNKILMITQFPTLPFQTGKNFDIQNGKDIYRIWLENGKEVVKWVSTIRALYYINNNIEMKEYKDLNYYGK